MDTRGNIAHFESDALAKEAGYDTRLTEVEAKLLQEHPKEERHRMLKKLHSSQKLKHARAQRRAKRKAQRAARKKQRS